MVLSYSYVRNGYTKYGDKIPNIPVIHLALRIGKYIARGLAIIDTGFDGGIYPNIDIIKLFRGIKPLRIIEFEHPTYGICEFEIYQAETYLYHNGKYISIGKNNIYIPTEPELITEEVLVGREILNKLKIVLDPQKEVVIIEARET